MKDTPQSETGVRHSWRHARRILLEAGREERAYWISRSAAILLSLVAFLSLVLAVINRSGYLPALSIVGMALVAWVGVYWIWTGRLERGIWIMIAGIEIITLILAVLTEGQGLLIGLTSFLLTISLSTLALTGAAQQRAVVLAAAVGVAVILFDFYGPPIGAPGNPLLTNILTGVILLLAAAVLLARFGAYSLRVKVLLAALLLSLIPMLALSWLNINQRTAELEQASIQTLLDLSGQAALSVDRFLETGLNNVRTQAQLPGFSDYLSLPVAARPGSQQERNVGRALLALQRSDAIFISSAALLDLNGINVMDTDLSAIGRDESQQPYFREAVRTNLPVISPVLIDPNSGEGGLYFSAPVRAANRETVGVLRLRYRASILQAILTESVGRDIEKGYAVLVDDDYFIRLAHTGNPGLIFKSYLSHETATVEWLQRSGRLPPGPPEESSTNQPEIVGLLRNIDVQPTFTTGASALGGEQAFTAATRSRYAPWIVLTRQAVSVIQEPIARQARSSVVLVLVTAGLVALVAIVGSQYLTAPLMQLTQTAQRYAAGDLSARSYLSTADEIGVLSRTFDEMAGELQQILQGLERRVAERTRAIELSAEVSRRLSTILDPTDLVNEVVHLIQQAFSYYHVHIYLKDETEEKLVMVGGTGEAGRTMLAQGHSIPLGRGLVGRAAESGAPVLVEDTYQDPDWLPNPLLPETRAEVAVPIMYGEQVIGVLDVQQNRVEGLSAADAELLLGIANQVAIALRNARQYLQAQQEAEREAQLSEIIRQIQSARTIESALQIATREIGRALGASRLAVRLGMDEGGNGAKES